MPVELGQIEAIFRYPVKSMRGESLAAAALGWHGLAGDRRLALRRLGQHGDFPWLTASKLPELILFTPESDGDAPATHVRTPEGERHAVFAAELAADIGRRHGSPVEMLQLRDGIFDDGSVSIITSETARAVCHRAGQTADVRRFRANIVVRSTRAVAFEEDEWLGGTLRFGDASDAPAVAVTVRDERCAMLNFDPDGGPHAPEMMKAAVQANCNHAGVYATVTRIGTLAVGQTVTLHR